MPVAASSYLARFLDPFCRAQIGYRVLNEEPVYQMLDMLIVPITDNHVRAIADSWEFYTDVEVYRVGVPHIKAFTGGVAKNIGVQKALEELVNVKCIFPVKPQETGALRAELIAQTRLLEFR